MVYGDATRVNSDLARLQAVTAGQIKEVLNRYLAGKKKVVIEYLPEAMKPAAQKKRKKILMTTRTLSRPKRCHPNPLTDGGGLGRDSRARLGVSLVAVALCLTTGQSARAIGGIDTPPAPSARHEIKFATPKQIGSKMACA